MLRFVAGLDDRSDRVGSTIPLLMVTLDKSLGAGAVRAVILASHVAGSRAGAPGS
jgi:hypothetical protein